MTIFLETKRLIIKAPTLSDFDNWYAVHAESEAMQYSKETIFEWLNHHILEYKQHGFSMCSVFLKNNNEFIGRAGLFYYPYENNQDPDIEMGYIIHKKFWNHGYATELAKGLIDWSLQNLEVNRVIALTRLDNTKSQHILEKVGMHSVEKIKSEGEDFFLYAINKGSK